LINIIQHINRIKNKNHIIISIGAKRAYEKIQDLFMKKALKKLRLEGVNLKIIKSMHVRYLSNVILNKKKLKAFPLKSEMMQRLPLIFNIGLEFRARTIGKKEK
jgi:hypothetical protein